MTKVSQPFEYVKDRLPIGKAIVVLTGVDPAGKKKINCPFPDHQDNDPSFNIYDKGKKFKCHGCGKGGSVIDFLMQYHGVDKLAACKRGFEILGEPFPENGDVPGGSKPEQGATSKSETGDRRKKDKLPLKFANLKNLPFDEARYKKALAECVEVYTYHAPDGDPHMQVFRKHGPDGRKSFSQWTWNGKHWVCGCPDDTPKYLYRIEKIKDADVVFLVEGEKDVHAIEALGLTATCWAGGAGALKGQCDKWDSLAPLAGKNVIFVVDNDNPGKEAFDGAQNFLFGRVNELRRVILPGVPEHGDTSDFLEIHKNDPNLRDLFLKTCLDVPQYLPDLELKNILYRADLLAKLTPLRPAPEEVVKGLIPIGLTILGGKKSARKSILCQLLGLAVANGRKALGYFETTKGTVIHASLEDDDYNWNDRLCKMLTGEHEHDARPTNLYAVFSISQLGAGLEEQIETWKRQHPDLKLIFLDILNRVLGSHKSSLRGASDGGYHETYEMLFPLKLLAKRLGIAIVIAHHLRKYESESKFDDFMGSTALGGVCDSMIVIKKIFRKEYQGILSWQGRAIRDTKPLALRFHGDSMTLDVIGEVDGCAMSEVQQKVLAELVSDGKPLRLYELRNRCGEGMTEDAFKVMVNRMAGSGLISRGTRGEYLAKQRLHTEADRLAC
ncbi:MAG: AAA family ATPase [Deltaproteobacteria bacterium]|nr:AAA family ATPase [Deltaproteobacteria bacterium]